MQGRQERIRQLCEQASREQNPTRLMELVKEIIETFDAQHARYTKRASAQSDSHGYGNPAPVWVGLWFRRGGVVSVRKTTITRHGRDNQSGWCPSVEKANFEAQRRKAKGTII